MHFTRFRSILTLVLTGLWLSLATPATADVMAPHVVTSTPNTDVCAMCHRNHTAGSEIQYREADTQAGRNALVVGKFLGGSDTDLCFSCHGTAGVGSNTNVQSAFESTSAHSLFPTASDYGPSPKSCSDCHDSHGSARTASGTPYPALLRAKTVTGTPVYTGEAYCATCHDRHITERYGGLAAFTKTGHYSGIAPPASGTAIRCSVCHDAHGSTIAPLVKSSIVPPAVLATVAVTANDRTLCLVCHAGPFGTYAGETTYAVSSHGISSKAVSITAEWASVSATRTVGECQNCHTAMGRSNGAGGVVPKLARDTGWLLCERCHSVKGPASADIASLSYPATAAPDPELAAVYSPSVNEASRGQAQLFSRDTSGSAPFALEGPRALMSAARLGSAASGDVDGDGIRDLVIADRSAKAVEVWSDDGRGGLSMRVGPGRLSVDETPDLVAVAEIVPNGGAAEIVTVSKQSGNARVYRYNGSALTLSWGPFYIGTAPSSIAVGDVRGTTSPDVVITDAAAGTFTILSGDSTTLTAYGPFSSGPGATGASIGEVWPTSSKNDIVVLNAGASSGQVSLFDGLGGRHGDYDTAGPAGATPTASAIGDTWPGVQSAGTSGKEIVVAMDGGAGTSGIDVFAQVVGGGLAVPTVYTTGVGVRSGSAVVADVDGDGRDETVVGNGGRWALDGTGMPPSIQLWHASTDGLSISLPAGATRWAGGMDLAGAAPSLVAADLGRIGPSRHDVSAATSSHVSTETTGFQRHVDCTDCHEVHQAQTGAAAAPAVYGALKGAWGVSVSNVSTAQVDVTQKQGVTYEYEVCFKCHSGWVALGGRRDMSFEFNALNPSVHAVEQTATTSQANAGSFVTGWGNSSVLHCIDCHGDADTSQPKGPHTSTLSPLLTKPYFGDLPSDAAALCYACHKYAVYYDGTSDGGASASLFGSAAFPTLHKRHVYTLKLACASCHVGHGSSYLPHLMRSGIGFADNGNGASCTNGCHGGATKSYTRP
ncbi:MAG TPA: hypothetical protein VGK50_00260 [Coriobacteriia bacterium]|jgi:hypothetical protein